MAIQMSTKLKEVLLEAMGNGGAGINFNSGVLEIRTGAAPGPNAAATGTILASITLPADAFAAASGNAMAKSGTWQDASANNTGTAAHFRLRQSGDGNGATGSSDERIEGTVTVTGGGGDLTVDSVSFTAGNSFTITSFTLAFA